jgi:hypothetical protein
MRDLCDYLPPTLARLFNDSIDNNYYPDSLKYTKLIELYKSGQRDNPINYRPISLLPIIAKILDILINKQLMTYLLDNKLISPTQYAFRPKTNTTQALQAVINNLHKQRGKHSKPTVALCIDLSKAYDTVSHVRTKNYYKNSDKNFTSHRRQQISLSHISKIDNKKRTQQMQDQTRGKSHTEYHRAARSQRHSFYSTSTTFSKQLTRQYTPTQTIRHL